MLGSWLLGSWEFLPESSVLVRSIDIDEASLVVHWHVEQIALVSTDDGLCASIDRSAAQRG